MTELHALTRRLDALERQNRRLRHTLVLVAAVAAAAAAGAAGVRARAQAAPAAVAGDRFELVDSQNRTRATLDMAAAQQRPSRYPVLTFLDAANKPRLRVGLGARGALLEVIDEAGKAKDYFGPVTARPLTQP